MLRLAVAASGGADSIALLFQAAHKFSSQHVIALSVDHRTRPSAAAERSHVAAVAARLGFRVHTLQIEPARPNQAAWREARLQALVQFCKAHGVGTLWFGHHRNDAEETAALRLLAEGNLSSLAGISAARCEAGIRIERPMLNRSSRQIRRELMARGTGWFEDPSNRDLHYRRVAVRSLLDQASNKVGQAVLVRRTAHWRAAWDRLLDDAWRLAVTVDPTGALMLKPAILQGLPPVLAEALLRQAARVAAGRDQRLRQADFQGALASGCPPWQLGGVRVWAHAGLWLAGRDYRHVRDVAPLVSGQEMTWDARYALALPPVLPPGDWRAARLGLPAARGLHLDFPAEWAAAALAVWDGPTLIAVPAFQVWNGAYAAFWQKKLAWSGLNQPNTGLFRVAP